MHLLAIQPGAVLDGTEAVDLGQTPGDIVVLSANDTDLAALAAAAARRPAGAPTLRLASPLVLRHPLSVDIYVEQVIRRARLVVVRLLGGRGYWPYGLDEIAAACRSAGVAFAALLDDDDDADSRALSILPPAARRRLTAYLREGGPDNADNFLRYAHALVGGPAVWSEPRPLLRAGLYWPGREAPGLDDVRAAWRPGAPVAALVFYRAYLAAGATGAIDAAVATLLDRGLNPLPVFVASLKDAFAADILARTFAQAPPDVVLNTTAFATGSPADADGGVLAASDAPVLQLAFAGVSREAWDADGRGLGARDLAMNVALPEVDGRLFAGAVAFKAEAAFDADTQCAIVRHVADPDQLAFACDLAAAWTRLRRAPPAERRIAFVLANYPSRDSRIGNGVGLDTPASVADLLATLRDEGYDVRGAPDSGRALMRRLVGKPPSRQPSAQLPLARYEAFLAGLPAGIVQAVTERWGPPEADPAFDPDARAFRIAAHRFGGVVVGVQPGRGYGLDPKTTYHDATLVPPHGYLAFYAWLRHAFGAHAVVHAGKHGTLEWLPGKALALSDACFPRAILGPTPQLYPFIVNDPGEGSQAKRRTAAAIVGHLTPPLTRAGSYGPLKQLEELVDEYYAASGLDPRRLVPLRREILALAAREGLDVDCGLDPSDPDAALSALDNHLCELKELQIRDGLHVFGRSPEGGQRTGLLVALLRAPRRHGEGGDASLLRALADDLALGFDPLAARLADPWTGPRPTDLARLSDAPWRTAGDTVERLERLAWRLVSRRPRAGEGWARTRAVLAGLDGELGPAVDACGAHERAGLLAGLAGRFVRPGPSGAPTRGRSDVLPTGRNFFSVDTRAVPTPTAWRLGWASAQMLMEDHLQRTGDYPRAIALSAWGTANMRTGGDDIAQALALMGVRPVWETSTGRVTGLEVLPLAALGRPRVDVTVRISGLFRDAFVDQVDLLASAARAIQDLDEDALDNPAAARWRDEAASLGDAARARVFGAAPGGFGTGLQTLVDDGLWRTRDELAEAYLAWSGYAYGAGQAGAPAGPALRARLAATDAVVQNQDNREHDLLDSNDYAQFEGGLAVAITALRGAAPVGYHLDHSRPERPVVRTLDEEIARVLRGRFVNPKWIAGVMRHDYRGAAEIAAGVDYLFAFAATTGAVRSHHFDLVHRAFVEDDAVRAFLADANPGALRDIARRLREAIDRGFWTPRSNSAAPALDSLIPPEAA
ncbi:cobaltochelatase subunit CobN [Phenylobacterium sp. SCN 70-31]|uniref:cobaltochelatase subunit CobN n=1 Tax=Phenylobacterium sp. SCN 70-31 TaxID=1660129 RepID=UPI00086F9513|nr:cobaltochelatase subunit CobN [Phenylobacterium sp. SCN 70-31]ODT89545.1 MAG: cobaltochelatase subunit CobN [Phenylobacterium sp. SCN 70-31]